MAEDPSHKPFITGAESTGNNSTQKGCTPWLLISCIILTMSTAFVFGWGLGAPNQYNTYTEDFLNGTDPCVAERDRNELKRLNDERLLHAGHHHHNDSVVILTMAVDSGDRPAVSETTETAVKVVKEKFNFVLELIKGIPQTVFLIGAFIGAVTGPFWPNCMNRKKTVYANFAFCFASSLCVLLSYYLQKPWLFYVSRLLMGYQGGMACVIVPPYIGEISSQRVRGAAGSSFQLALTIGILIAQVVGLPFIAGTCKHWGWGLAIVFVLPLISTVLMLLVPNSPTQLIRKYNDEKQAEIDLKKLRNTEDVRGDLDNIHYQARQEGGTESLSIPAVLTTARYRWPMLTTIVLQMAQALSGINAVFFYSSKMFEKAGIKKDLIPYANIGTGIINVLATIVALSLIEKVGRRALIIYPMGVMVLVFGILTALVEVNERINNPTLGWFSVIFVLIFVVCFAVGLGPIPFIYSSEVCRPEARDSVQALGLVANYLGNILLSLFFPALNSILGGYVFLIFFVLVLLHLAFLYVKMPETKNKTIEEAERFWKIPTTVPTQQYGKDKLLPVST
ncbi:unnamed protein product [Didymodactylos carnosus]|uniref:Major facilitator superfamily (MFS) profile domain-containing protein n=1 Tax=Didymodactylos carnosus TaxID=1234261 RepID=A0A814GDL1_9BILA|nr:unnamed protein product [Didymodactylos carnosus]CAF1103358.1 unnamed protein product [Didymodactylos carnosus]CAF3766087.1 unnamed protein product [Didymodactylos carnosus]CAF3864852.1 unnamed protein product [Didymodactylos carnosus]